MSENDKYTVTDLMANVLDQKPIEATLAFNELMINKLQTAINDRKVEIAQTMFNPSFNSDNDTTEVETNGEAA